MNKKHKGRKRKWCLARLVASSLAVVMLVNSLQLKTVGAAPITREEKIGQKVDPIENQKDVYKKEQIDDGTESSTDVSIVGEIEELREEDTKHFRLSDGSFVAITYGMPVHFKDAKGEWKDIDNQLVMISDDTGTASYQSSNENTSVSFASNLENGNLFTATHEDVSVSMSLLDTSQAYQMVSDTRESEFDENILESSVETVSGNEILQQDTQKNTIEEKEPPKSKEYVRTGSWESMENEENVINHYEEDLEFSRSAFAQKEDAPAMFKLENDCSWDVEEIIPPNLQSSIRYEDTFSGVDLVYTTCGYNIKEQIVVNEAQDAYRYDFLLDFSGLSAELNSDGSVSLIDTLGTIIYSIPMPYMEDASGHISFNVWYSLAETDEGTILTVEADEDWINSEERTFPVKIDPTLILQPGNTESDLLIANVKKRASEYDNLGNQYIWTNALLSSRIFVHFDGMPTLPAGCEVVDASLGLCTGFYSSTKNAEAPVGLYEVSGEKPSNYSNYADWFAAMTWYNQPNYNIFNIIDYAMASSECGYLEWDISELVKKWYMENTENTTIILKMMNEYDYDETVGYYAYGNNCPVFVVSYRSTTGMEPYYTYTALEAGNAGTGYIADYTGQFKVVREIASYASAINPFSLNLVYNSDFFSANAEDYQPAKELGLSMKMGAGWTIDVIQSIASEKILEQDYIRYHDGDGTIHYFLKNGQDGLYYDEDGLGLTIRKVNELNYEMTDQKDNLWIFQNGFLKEIVDNNRTNEKGGNRYVINYDATNKITNIVQKNANGASVIVAEFGYNSGGYLISIKDSAGHVTYLNYSGNDLVSISRQNYLVGAYTYSEHRITQMKDTNQNYALNLEYWNGRVSAYYETGNGIRGAECHISYPNACKTVYWDYGLDRQAGNDDICTYCLFDYAGRTVNMYTTANPSGEYAELRENVLSASNASYTVQTLTGSENSNIAKAMRTNNRISCSSSLGVVGQQLIQDFGFEIGLNNTAWNLEGAWSEGNGTAVTIVGDNPRTGNYSLKGWIPKNNSSTTGVGANKLTTNLKAGETYTMSAYVNTSQIVQTKGAGVYLEVLYGGTTLAKSNCVDYISSTDIDNGWVRISATFKAAADAPHTVRIYNDRAEGIFFADDLQLEKAEAPSDVNLLENGDMNIPGIGWVIVEEGQYSIGSMLLFGSPENENVKFYQDVPINLPGTETYILSGWVCANAVPDNIVKGNLSEDEEALAKDTEKQCGLRAIVNYTDGTTEYHYVAFEADIKDWQFASMAIVPKKTDKIVDYIRVIGAYEKNANSAWFDKLSLVRETAQVMDYDRDGNLIAITSTGLSGETSTYENGNLIQSVTGGQGTYKYDYDDAYTHRLNKVTMEGVGISQSYNYDTVGNVTNTTLESNVSGGKKLQSTATYNNSGNLLMSVTDSDNITINYAYGDTLSQMFGLPTTITDAKGDQNKRTYDTFGRITSEKTYDIEGGAAKKINEIQYTYSEFRPYEIQRTNEKNSTQTYRFSYDDFGNLNKLQVGGRTLATYDYGEKNGLLHTLTYGNGDKVNYTYDVLGRVVEAKHETGRLSYTYNGEGLLHSILDEHQDGEASRFLFTYDSLDRLCYSERLNNGSYTLRTANEYNEKDQLVSQRLQMNGIDYTQQFGYEAGDGKLQQMVIDLEKTNNVDYTINMGYDYLRRPLWVDNNLYTTSYTYKDRTDNTNLTTTQVQSLWYSSEIEGGIAFHYDYDKMGNIKTYQEPSGTTTYEYDAQNQLTKATKGNIKYTYTYDSVGNILTASDGVVNHTYTYGDSNWKDLLTAYDGHQFQYDGVGNPLKYYNGTTWNFSWADGRKLVSAENSNGTVKVNYVYDVDGTRRNKTVNGVTHYYIWDGSKPLKEYVAGNTDVYKAGDTLFFFYDQNGRPFALQYNGTTYYYILNLQGDVVEMVDGTGGVVARYTYDPYGNILSSSGKMAKINPLRYRGYYYESETGFYLTETRYYDPQIGRFMNADGYVATGQGVIGTNMFAYCGNNPVNRMDTTGQFWNGIWELAKIAVAETTANIEAWAPAYAGCGGMYLADGPLPIGDILGTVGVTLLTVAAIVSGVTLAVQIATSSIPKEKEETKAVAITSNLPPNQTIYRWGGTSPGNLTPKQKDLEPPFLGLSFSLTKKPGSAQTTAGQVNATGVLVAVRDGIDHVSVYPIGGSMVDWVYAGPHSMWIQALKSVVVKCK